MRPLVLLALLVLAANAQPFIAPYVTTSPTCAAGVTVCSFFLTNPTGELQATVTSFNVTTTYVPAPPNNNIAEVVPSPLSGPNGQANPACSTWLSAGSGSSNNVFFPSRSVSGNMETLVWYTITGIAPGAAGLQVLNVAYTGNGYLTQTWRLLFT